ncbi:terpene synthase family protein [Aspergillus foveolatus]|uniref:terpene synthase family protein n=1 Tax=Aspergillus foveolatus TaxID=210207 RepID=UPI003CCDDCA1
MPERTTNPALSLAEFRKSIRGQKATLPNFYSLFPDWIPDLHPEYERARDEILNPWLERWVPNPTTARKFQEAEFGVFAAVMCVRTSFEKLCTVCKAFAWFFIWDDLFDCGSLATNNEAAFAYRRKSMQYFCAVLCKKEPMPDLSDLTEELQNTLHCWDEVAAHLRQECSQGSLQLIAVYKTLIILLEQIIFYVSSVDTVDMLFRGNHVPSLAEYWIRREQTAGVYPVIATIPFIYGTDITHKIIDAELMQSLWRHTSFLVHMINDMFSLRKEIADNQIENMVTVIMLNHGVDCKQAMRLSHQFVEQEAAQGFQKVERRLRAQSLVVSTERSSEDAFIEGCKNVVMGLTHWSYSGQRYFRQSELNERHEVDFHI